MAKTSIRPIMTKGIVTLPLSFDEPSLAPGRVWVGLVGIESEADPLGFREEDFDKAEELLDGSLVALLDFLEEFEVPGSEVNVVSFSFAICESYFSK